jgi:Rieske Fe-S protein
MLPEDLIIVDDESYADFMDSFMGDEPFYGFSVGKIDGIITIVLVNEDRGFAFQVTDPEIIYQLLEDEEGPFKVSIQNHSDLKFLPINNINTFLTLEPLAHIFGYDYDELISIDDPWSSDPLTELFLIAYQAYSGFSRLTEDIFKRKGELIQNPINSEFYWYDFSTGNKKKCICDLHDNFNNTNNFTRYDVTPQQNVAQNVVPKQISRSSMKSLLRYLYQGVKFGSSATGTVVSVEVGGWGDTIPDIIFLVVDASVLAGSLAQMVKVGGPWAKRIYDIDWTPEGPDGIRKDMNKILAEIEAQPDAVEIYSKICGAYKDILNTLAAVFASTLAVFIPDDAGLTRLAVENAITVLAPYLGKAPFEVLKWAYNLVPDKLTVYLHDPEKMKELLMSIFSLVMDLFPRKDDKFWTKAKKNVKRIALGGAVAGYAYGITLGSSIILGPVGVLTATLTGPFAISGFQGANIALSFGVTGEMVVQLFEKYVVPHVDFYAALIQKVMPLTFATVLLIERCNALFTGSSINVPVSSPQNVLAQQIPVQQIPAQQIPVQQIPAQQIPVQQIPAQQIPAQQIPAQQIPVQQIPAQQIPVQQIPAQQIPVQHIPVQQIPSQQISPEIISALQTLQNNMTIPSAPRYDVMVENTSYPTLELNPETINALQTLLAPKIDQQIQVPENIPSSIKQMKNNQVQNVQVQNKSKYSDLIKGLTALSAVGAAAAPSLLSSESVSAIHNISSEAGKVLTPQVVESLNKASTQLTPYIQNATNSTGQNQASDIGKAIGTAAAALTSILGALALAKKSQTSQVRSHQVRSPQITLPQVRSPQITLPQVRSPQITLPQVRSPQVRSPQITLPQVRSPQVRSPQVRSPQITLPQVRSAQTKY